jgi:hypothetical protein
MKTISKARTVTGIGARPARVLCDCHPDLSLSSQKRSHHSPIFTRRAIAAAAPGDVTGAAPTRCGHLDRLVVAEESSLSNRLAVSGLRFFAEA